MLTRPPGSAPEPTPESELGTDPELGREPELGTEPEDRWVGAHVFTGHPLDLVVGALVPGAVAELRQRGLTDRFFFLRHWQGGPHLRLRVRLTAPAAEPEVRATLEAHADAFFRARPPSQGMTAPQYRSLAAQLAAHEPESEPGTLSPNDSLAFHAYRPEHGKYGRGAALRAVEDAFATCSELALAAVLAGWGPARRAAHCFALLAGSLDASAAPGRPAPEVLARYGDRRAALLGVARAARAETPAETPADAPADPAAEAVDPAGADPVRRWLAACRNAQRQAASPARLAGHLTHLACNRLDVRLGQEASLRGLALLAVSELTGEDRTPVNSSRVHQDDRTHARGDGTEPP